MENERKPYTPYSSEDITNKYKGMVGREFEKVCPTTASFKAVLHTLHDIFASMKSEMDLYYTPNNKIKK